MKIKFSLIISIIIFFVLGYLSLPQFVISIGETKLEIKGLDLKLIFPNSNLGDFRRGEGLFATKEKKVSLILPETLTGTEKEEITSQFLDIVRERIKFSGFYTVNARAVNESGEYFIVLSFPEYFENLEQAASLLVAPGVITFSADPSLAEDGNTSALPAVTLHDYDIEGTISSDYIDQLNNVPIGNHLVFRFKESKLIDFTDTMVNNQGLILMNVDGLPAFSVIRHDTKTESVRAIPNNFFADLNQKNLYLNIVRTYFLTEAPLAVRTELSNGATTMPALFVTEGATTLAIAFMLTAFVFAITFLIKKRIRGLFSFVFMFGSYIFLTVVLLKLPGATLSIYSIIGFILIYLYGLFNVVTIINASKEELKNLLFRFKNASFFLLILAAVLFQLTNIYWLNDFISVILIGSISSLVVNSFNFKELSTILYQKNTHE